MTGLVLEGIVGSGKTSVSNYLKKLFLDQNSSLFFLSECATERALEPLSKATTEQSVAYLTRWVSVLETVYDTQRSHPKATDQEFSFLFERFHLSHCLDIAGYERFSLYNGIDRQLKLFGCKLVLLTVKEEMIPERSVISTKRLRDEKWNKYLAQIAATDDALAAYYQNQQQNFIRLCRQSQMKSLSIGTSGRNWEDISFQIIEFLNRS